MDQFYTSNPGDVMYLVQRMDTWYGELVAVLWRRA